jgi:hypothetical protein
VRRRLHFLTALMLIASMAFAATSTFAYHADEQQYHPIATDEFFAVWERTDYPVQQLEVAGTWIWGPGGFSELLVEDYAEGEDGERQVQYFDKSRMEMPTLGAADTDDQDSPWFITQGLLATELMTGQLQLGDDTFEQYNPSNRSAAGDPGDTTAPTYAAMGTLIERDARAGGEVIVEYANRDGATVEDETRFAGFGVTDVEGDWQDVEGIDKNIASVFWDFMTSERLIYDAEEDDFVTDDLFLNAFYAVGYPLTDAFWADVTVDNVEQNVLIQCFERRCLTYTPGNPDGWEVESGNIGQHYYDWRYHQIPTEPTINVMLEFDPYDPDSVVEPTVAGADIAILTEFEPQNFALTTASLVDQFGNPLSLAGEAIEFRATAGDDDTRVRGGDGFYPTLEGEEEEYFTGPEATNPLVASTDADGEAFLYFRRSLGPEVGMHNGVIVITATHVETGASDSITVQFIEGDDVVRDDH